MHLQKLRSSNALHLPSTRQRNDGFHENHFEDQTSSLIFPLQYSKTCLESLRKYAAIAAVFAALAAPQMLNLQTAHAQNSSKPVGTWGRTTGNATYMRIRPGVQTPIVAKVPRGTQLMVWGTFDGWYRVETTDHKFGWIHHDLVNVPRADKLKTLSHAKAIQASNRTGNQTLYGDSKVLKQYYAKHKAPGAKVGLQKQGISLVKATPKPAAKPVPVVVKAPSKPAAKPIVVKTTTPPNAPRHITITTAEPEVVQAKVLEVQAEEKVVATPVVVRASTRSTELASRKSTPRAAAKPLPQPEVVSVEPMSPSKLPQITANDIMNARRSHMQNQQLASRHKTRPGTVKSSPDSTIKTAPAVQAKVQPSSADDEILGQPYIVDVAKKAPSRGGSPRDYAKYSAKNGNQGSAMASQALSYRGMPYIRGASSPKRGFDCSGLIYHILRSRGYNPPRTAAGYASYGTPVAKKDLKAGDLVLFANTYKRGISHIGVYTGNGNFVHAANARAGVRTDSMNSAYYSRKYYGARRVPVK